MTYLLLAVLCSVTVSVLFKLFPRWNIDPGQAVAWNYAAAAALVAWRLHAPLAVLRAPAAPWPAWLLLALVLPGGFLLLAASVRSAGIVRTDIAQRLSLLLSLAAAFAWFGEAATPAKLAGLALGVLALLLLLWRPAATATAGAGRWWLPLAVLGVYAVVDVTLKFIAQAGTPFAASLLAAFALAFALMLALQIARHWTGRTVLGGRHLLAGLLLGALNCANIVCYVRAHQALATSPATVFAAMNIGVVLAGSLVGALAFGERLRARNWLAVPLAVAAIVLVARAGSGG
ncbi:MAG: EamA/RhaT family transporter [Pseudoxanthomonas sp.]